MLYWCFNEVASKEANAPRVRHWAGEHQQSFNEVASKEANAPASYQVFVTSVKKPTTARTSSFDMDDVRFVIAMRSQLIDSLTLFRCANLNGKGHHSEFAQNSPIP